MTSPTQIVDDIRAFVTSSITTAVAVSLGVTGMTASVLALHVVPADKQNILVTIAAVAAGITTGGRQAIAWLDSNNSSFGRVKIDGPPPEGDTQNPDATDPHDTSGEVAAPNEPDVPADGQVP